MKLFKTTQEFTFIALMLALTILFNFIGLLPSLAASSAYLIFLPTMLVSVLYGMKKGAMMGALAGAVTLVRALLAPQSILDPLFINPLVSILPRIFIGVTPWLVYNVLSKFIKNKTTQGIIGGACAGAIGAITNTALVMTMLYVIYEQKILQLVAQFGITSFKVLLIGIITSNAIMEAVIYAILMSAVVTILNKTKIANKR